MEWEDISRIVLRIRQAKVDLFTVGARIRALRGEMPQESLAAYLGIRQGQLSKIERGRAAPTLEVLVLLSDRFDKSIDWILRGSGNYRKSSKPG